MRYKILNIDNYNLLIMNNNIIKLYFLNIERNDVIMKKFVLAGKINLNKNYYKLVFLRDNIYINALWQDCHIRINGEDKYCHCYIAKNQAEYNSIINQNNRRNGPIYKIINKNDPVNLYYVFNLETYYNQLYIIDEDIYNQKE